MEIIQFLVSYWWIILLLVLIVAIMTRIIKKLLFIVFILLGLFFIIIAGSWAYSKYFKFTYIDKTYGFKILDQRGWGLLKNKTDAYYSIGTGDKNTVISYFEVRPIESLGIINKDKILTTIKDSCYQEASTNNYNVIEFQETKLNNLSGFVCVRKGKATNVDQIYVMKQYTLMSTQNKKYDFILTVTYPKGNVAEEEKVNRLLQGFYSQ